MPNLLPLDIDGQTVYVEVKTYGSEETSPLDEALERAEGAFDRAKTTITGVAKSLVGAVRKLDQAVAPDEFSLEFGIKFSAGGKVILADVGAEATLKVTMLYKHGKET